MLTKLSVISIIVVMMICPATVLVTPTDADSDIVYKGTEIDLTTYDVERMLSESGVIPQGMSLKSFMESSINEKIKSTKLSYLSVSAFINNIDYRLTAKVLAEGSDGSVLMGSFGLNIHVDMIISGYLPKDGSYSTDSMFSLLMSLSQRTVPISLDFKTNMSGKVVLGTNGYDIESAELNLDGITSISVRAGANASIQTDNEGKLTGFTISYADTMYYLNTKTHVKSMLDIVGMDIFSHSEDPIGTAWSFQPVVTVRDLEANMFLDASSTFTDPMFDRMGVSVYDRFLKTSVQLNDYINPDGSMNVDLKKVYEDSLKKEIVGTSLTMKAMARIVNDPQGQKSVSFSPIYAGLANGGNIDITYGILPTIYALEDAGVYLPAYADQVDLDYFRQIIVAAMDGAPEGLDLTEYKAIADAMGYTNLEFREYSVSEAAELRENINNSLYNGFTKTEINVGAVAAGLAAVIALLSIGAVCVYKRP